MTDELLDLVNLNDEVFGEVWKSKAHADPKLIHREVSVIIYDPNDNRILFQKRSLEKKINPGVWTESSAGHVPKGMKPTDAAHKELREELGFDTQLKILGKTIAKLPYETHFTYWFVGKYSGEEIKVQEEEVEKVKFLSQTELEKLVEKGEKYDPLHLGGHSEDMVRKFWKKVKNIEEHLI